MGENTYLSVLGITNADFNCFLSLSLLQLMKRPGESYQVHVTRIPSFGNVSSISTPSLKGHRLDSRSIARD